MIEPTEPDPYFQAIEEAFNRRRGAPLLLAPRDWALIGEWKRTGVPLRIVLQGIDSCFDAHQRRAPSARRINSLSYCRQEVLGLHELYLGLHGADAGRPAETTAGTPAAAGPARAVARHLSRLQRRLRESMAWCSENGLDPLVGALAETAAEVRVLRRRLGRQQIDPHALEEALARLEEVLLAAARAALPEEERRLLDAQVEMSLEASRHRMTPVAVESTRNAAAARLLRQRCRLPRLSLFD